MILVALAAKASKVPFPPAKPRKLGMMGLLDKDVRDILQLSGAHNFDQFWWGWLRHECLRLLSPTVNRADAGGFADFLHLADRQTAFFVIRFLNAHYQDWDDGTTVPSDGTCEDAAREGVCDDCERNETCNEDCDVFYEYVAEHRTENTDWNLDYIDEAWVNWQEEEEFIDPPTSPLLTPAVIGSFQPIEYMAQNCEFTTPQHIAYPVTFEQLQYIAQQSHCYQTLHAMNLWCRLILAYGGPDTLKVGTQRGAREVLQQPGHQEYMTEAGIECEVAYEPADQIA